MKTETHDLINKDVRIGTTQVSQFSTLVEAVTELGEAKCLTYINKMWKNVQVNKARAQKLKESATPSEVYRYISEKARKLTSDADRNALKVILGPIADEVINDKEDKTPAISE